MFQEEMLGIPQYEAGRYPLNQLDIVQKLFSQAFGGRTIGLDMLQWQMEKNPCLKYRATTLWYGEELVAYKALTPSLAILNGKNVISAVSGTLMADRRFPGASIQLCTECARQNEDIDMIYGFPNHNSFGILMKYLNHHYVGDIAFWSAKPKKVETSDAIREFWEFTDEYQVISRKLSEGHEFIKLREKNYLNWRFFQKPYYQYRGFEYEKRGYIVVDIYMENGMKQLQIVDILSDTEEVMDKLLKYAVNLALDLKCEILKLWLTSRKYETVLGDNGFSYGLHPFAMTVWNQEIDISRCYFTMADSDIF